MITETALVWLNRCQQQNGTGKRKRRRRNDAADRSSLNDADDETCIHAATDPSTAAWRFLRYGRSGIAPIDIAWKRSHHTATSSMFFPPVTVLEGPKDVGKTWMLLTLAARFVVATRASRFQNCDNDNDKRENEINPMDKRRKGDPNSKNDEADENGSNDGNIQGQPKVLLLDSTYDLSLPQLANIVRLTLLRERQKERQRNRGMYDRGEGCQSQRQHINVGVRDDKNKNNYPQEQQRNIEDALGLHEREKLSFERDMEDCLNRIQIIQVDNGPTGWVSILEALTYKLSEEYNHGNPNSNARSRCTEPFSTRPPTLLLWDGFLSDMPLSTNAMMAQSTSVVLGESMGNYNSAQVLFESPSSQELLIQLSRLLQKHTDALWLVLTARTKSIALPNDIASNSHSPETTEQSGIGLKLTEWIRKDEERKRRELDSIRERHSTNRYEKHNQPKVPHRASYRIRLDRRHDSRAPREGSLPSTTAAAAALYAKVVGSSNHDLHGSSTAVDEKIPYSISLGGILS